MTSPMTMVRLHTDEQRQLVHQLRTSAEGWLKRRGLDQFQPESPTKAARAHEFIDGAFDREEFVGLEVDDRIVAVGAIAPQPDPDFWTPAERSQRQVYVGRFLVAEHGHGYGRKLLTRIAADEAGRGTPILRLDCWRTNHALQDYYLRLGFRRLRIEPVAGRGSGALFELNLQSDDSPLMQAAAQLREGHLT